MFLFALHSHNTRTTQWQHPSYKYLYGPLTPRNMSAQYSRVEINGLFWFISARCFMNPIFCSPHRYSRLGQVVFLRQPTIHAFDWCAFPVCVFIMLMCPFFLSQWSRCPRDELEKIDEYLYVLYMDDAARIVSKTNTRRDLLSKELRRRGYK